MVRRLLAGCLAGLILGPSVLAQFRPWKLHQACAVSPGPVTPGQARKCQPPPEESHHHTPRAPDAAGNRTKVLDDVFAALAVLQNHYFDPVNGTWPSSIDWTGAVVETVLSGTLTTLAESLASRDIGGDNNWEEKENLVSSLYDQVVHSFFGQNTLALQDEAYDDMLWVVLGWLEAIKFVRVYADLNYPGSPSPDCLSVPGSIQEAFKVLPWKGYTWFCAFAHRARGFWDLATAGWDTSLCHGGMVWNPRLEPYKNAITNELWIAASMAMYEHFPNDTFQEAWVARKGLPTHNPVYLAAAVDGYKWLRDSNMTNAQGLYVDGFHIDRRIPGNVECDVRDEMVYTYNQGVVLTGQRGLWTATGSPSYLHDGHQLVASVIKATGWDMEKQAAVDDVQHLAPGTLPPWRGIGRHGILEEQCDASGTCSQDAQAFKGIFFHHLTAFCAPVERPEMPKVDQQAYARVKAAHAKACRAYAGWVKHNMEAALATRDTAGRFGMWWGAGLPSRASVSEANDGIDHAAGNATDYRSKGTPQNALWGVAGQWVPGARGAKPACEGHALPPPPPSHRLAPAANSSAHVDMPNDELRRRADDPNSRGRARTVETQAGGLALLRAYYELSR